MKIAFLSLCLLSSCASLTPTQRTAWRTLGRFAAETAISIGLNSLGYPTAFDGKSIR